MERKGIVTEVVVERMRRWTPESKRKGAIKWLGDREPTLSALVDDEIAKIAGRLALGGAPPPVVEQLAGDLCFLAAKIYIAMDLGHGQIWNEEFFSPLKHGTSVPSGPALLVNAVDSPGTGKTSMSIEMLRRMLGKDEKKGDTPRPLVDGPPAPGSDSKRPAPESDEEHKG